MKYEEARNGMVQEQLMRRGINSRAVLRAMSSVPREEFVPREFWALAYRDRAVPIGEGQTISQPYVVALMIAALEVNPGDRVLEIGTGSGYQAAILAEMGAQVTTIERQDRLAREAARRLRKLGYGGVEVLAGDGSAGWLPNSPYEGILVAASGPQIPNPLLEQLSIGGRLVMPIARGAIEQELVQIQRVAEGRYERKEFGPVVFVPLIGKEGWDSDGPQRWW